MALFVLTSGIRTVERNETRRGVNPLLSANEIQGDVIFYSLRHISIYLLFFSAENICLHTRVALTTQLSQRGEDFLCEDSGRLKFSKRIKNSKFQKFLNAWTFEFASRANYANASAHVSVAIINSRSADARHTSESFVFSPRSGPIRLRIKCTRDELRPLR